MYQPAFDTKIYNKELHAYNMKYTFSYKVTR